MARPKRDFTGDRADLKRQLRAELPALLALLRRFQPLQETEPLAMAALQLDARLKQELDAQRVPIDVSLRPNQCRLIKAEVGGAFPNCTVTTNDDMNAGTPIIVSCEWRDGKTHAVRAERVMQTNDDARDFSFKAVERLKRWRQGIDGGTVVPA